MTIPSFDKSNIKSVSLHRLGFELSDPIIELNTGEKLSLSFDDLDDQVKSYSYTIQHCNAEWNPSDLLPSEYIQGFTSDQINDYAFSLNTTTPYIHYELEFPTNYLQLTKSGNYFIIVYENDNKNEVVFKREFKVVAPKVKIEAAIKPPLSIKDKNNKQEIGFKIFLNNFYVSNPSSSLKVQIQQNNRTDNIIANIKPVRNQGNVLDYEFNNQSIFDGGNEYRALNIKSLKYKSERIEAIDYLSDGYHIYLKEDLPRFQKNYIFENDINGDFLIKTEDDPDSSTEGNYCWVHFRLKAESQLIGKNIFICGGLTNGLPDEALKMKFNSQSNEFEGSLFLKQGYYDYLYMAREKGQSATDISLTEGNHYETNNTYSIFVYYREPGTLYDQLIGFEKITGPQK